MLKKLFTGMLMPRTRENGTLIPSLEGVTITIILYIFLFVLIWGSFGIIDETERGVRVTLGKVNQEVVQPGMYTKLPLITSIVRYDVKVIKEDTQMETYTKDIQTAKLKISTSFQLDKEDLPKVYAQYGINWEEKIIWNNLSQQVKDVMGKYDAENLIENRDTAAQTIFTVMNEKISNLPATLTQFQILDIEYNTEFEKAVEAKVVAGQRAKEAENKTKQIIEEAKQKVETATAEATAMRIKTQALAQNKALVDYEIATRWNGVLPTTVVGGNSSIPLLNLK